jgi:hypothetical protein
MELTEDYLEADREIRGQNYVCLSFISPENVLKNKQMFLVNKFLQSISSEYNLDEKKVEDKYKDFLFSNETELNSQFSELNNFKTSVRGLKVRGTYDTLQEAEMRAKRLQKSDPNFNVFVGQVGYWLPWDPVPAEIGKESYLNDDLNSLMSKYKENMEERDEIFNTRKRDLIQKNNLEVKEQLAKLEELESEKEQIDNISESLQSEDPWLSRQSSRSVPTETVNDTSSEINLAEELSKVNATPETS